MDRLDYFQWTAIKSIRLTWNAHSDSVEAVGFQLGNVGCADAVSLDVVDVYNEVLTVEARSAMRRRPSKASGLYLVIELVVRG